MLKTKAVDIIRSGIKNKINVFVIRCQCHGMMVAENVLKIHSRMLMEQAVTVSMLDKNMMSLKMSARISVG